MTPDLTPQETARLQFAFFVKRAGQKDKATERKEVWKLAREFFERRLAELGFQPHDAGLNLDIGMYFDKCSEALKKTELEIAFESTPDYVCLEAEFDAVFKLV